MACEVCVCVCEREDVMVVVVEEGFAEWGRGGLTRGRLTVSGSSTSSPPDLTAQQSELQGERRSLTLSHVLSLTVEVFLLAPGEI